MKIDHSKESSSIGKIILKQFILKLLKSSSIYKSIIISTILFGSISIILSSVDGRVSTSETVARIVTLALVAVLAYIHEFNSRSVSRTQQLTMIRTERTLAKLDALLTSSHTKLATQMQMHVDDLKRELFKSTGTAVVLSQIKDQLQDNRHDLMADSKLMQSEQLAEVKKLAQTQEADTKRILNRVKYVDEKTSFNNLVTIQQMKAQIASLENTILQNLNTELKASVDD